jgi:RNA polymerase sigma factor (sigma-70 family)
MHARARRLLDEAAFERWDVSAEALAAALERSAAKAFAGRTPSAAELDRYCAGLHLQDLTLACACGEGNAAAWDHFVLAFRPMLYRAADAIDATGRAREMADALHGELYSRSLFRYFHGRSSLATWLRSLVAQRHVDGLRATARLDSLPDEGSPAALPARDTAPNPDRARYVRALHAALAAALAALKPRDRLRLRCYYAEAMTLAEIGRATREHEATVSRQLARTRRAVRDEVERRLRDEHRFTDREIAESVSSVAGDPGTLDLGRLLGDRKNSGVDRSTIEDVS